MERRKKILVIDDDEAVLALLAAKLGKRYDTVLTTEPKHAVALAATERPDVVLCDIDMPRMSGGDVAAALDADPRTARIPVVYLTALVSPQEALELGGQVGGRRGVSKRAPLTELMAAIDEAAP
jgi:CheY-like chemotaxis protein